MECTSCGYKRKQYENTMEGVCPSCNIVYEKVQCALFWSPTLELLPSTISKAYVIISDTKIYAVNKATKNILTEIILTKDEIEFLLKALHINDLNNPLEAVELIKILSFDQLNLIYAITHYKIFDYSSRIAKKIPDISKKTAESKTKELVEINSCIDEESVNEAKKDSQFKNSNNPPKYSNFQSNTSLVCKQCGDIMIKSSYSYGNFVGIFGALIVFFFGILLFFVTFFTLIGPLIGLLLIIMSLGMGGKREKVWKCLKCGYYFKRI